MFLLGFLILVFIIPSIRVYKQTGINPFRFITKHDQVHDFIGVSMKAFILMLLITVTIYSFIEQAYEFLAPFKYMETKALKIIGLVLGHLSLIGIMVAQWQMKQSWRIGIDYENKTALVNKGVFSISRNPIYLFLLIGLTGLFLIIPNAITFAVLFAANLILQIAIRIEEGFLLQQHGEVYVEYKKRVRRLI